MLHTLTTDPASNSPLYLLYPVRIIFVQDPKGANYSDYRPSKHQSSILSLLYTFSILLVSFLYKIQKVLHTLTTYPESSRLLYLLYPVRIIFVQDPKGAAYSDYRPSEQQSIFSPLYLLYPVSIIFVQDPKGAAYSDYIPRSFSILLVSFLYKIQKVLHTLTTYPESNRPLYLLYPVRIIFAQDPKPKGSAYFDYRPSEQQTSLPSLSS